MFNKSPSTIETIKGLTELVGDNSFHSIALLVKVERAVFDVFSFHTLGENLINFRFQFFNMRDYLNPASVVLFPAAKVSFNFLLQATDNYFPSLDRIKFKAAGCLSFLCLPLGMFSFHCIKLKMVVGLFVYQHLFSSRETKFLINLLRTHPRFRSATWPLLLPQVLRYPLGRDYSVTPPLSVERGNS